MLNGLFIISAYRIPLLEIRYHFLKGMGTKSSTSFSLEFVKPHKIPVLKAKVAVNISDFIIFYNLKKLSVYKTM